MTQISGNRHISELPDIALQRNSATLYFVQSPKKVKRRREPSHLATATGIGLVVVAGAAFVGASVMHLVGRPLGWSVMAVVGGMSALGLAGVGLVSGIAETLAKRLRHKEEL
jgi:predicted phage tail protein